MIALEYGGRHEMIEDCRAEGADGSDSFPEEDLDTVLDTVEDDEVEGDQATVTFQIAAEVVDELDPSTIEVKLVREEGTWKVDNLVPVVADLAEDSPEAAARDHAQAVLDRDCGALFGVLSEEAKSELGRTPEGQMERLKASLRAPG